MSVPISCVICNNCHSENVWFKTTEKSVLAGSIIMTIPWMFPMCVFGTEFGAYNLLVFIARRHRN